MLASILDKEVVNGFLRPGLPIFLDFHRRHPCDSAIESNKVKDDAYWGDSPLDAAATKPDIELEITDLTVFYQSVTPAAHLLPSLLRGPSMYYVDVSRSESTPPSITSLLSIALYSTGTKN